MAKDTVSIIVRADGTQAQRELKKTAGALGDLEKSAGKLKSIGSGLVGFGSTLTAAVTGPLLALGGLGVKAALEMDKARTKITALVGDSVKAGEKIKELQALADNSIGVSRKAALDQFAQMKGLKIDDQVINQVIKSMGKLNAAFDIEDVKGFTQNLNQIFKQGFERADIKEAIGRVPIFEDLLKSAFGTDDGAKLKALKDSGKLTIDTFLSGISGAIEQNPAIGNIQENLSTKLSKAWERLETSLAPVGDVILKTIVPAMEQLAPYIQDALQWFSELSEPMKTATVALGAIAAAIGPVVVAIGGIALAVSSIIELVAAIGGMATLGPIIAGVAAALAIITTAAAALYLAWQTNFGGIRDLVFTVWEAIKAAFETAKVRLTELTAELTGEIQAFWAENGEDIKKALQTVSDYIRSIWEGVVAFWAENGDTIKEYTAAAWDAVKTVIKSGMQVIGGVIKLAAALINRDWGKAWQAIKDIVSAVLTGIWAYIKGAANNFLLAIKLLFKAALALAPWIGEQFKKLGQWVIEGIGAGIKGGAGKLADLGRWIGEKIWSAAKSFLGISSPSKLFAELGEYTVAGLIVGIEMRSPAAVKASKKFAEDVTKAFKDAVDSFRELAGASPETVQKMGAIDMLGKARADLEEIVKLRNELKVNLEKPLPASPTGAAIELENLQRMKADAEEFKKTLEDLGNYQKDMAKIREDDAKRVEEINAQTRLQGEINILNLQKELELMGVVDPVEKARIENAYELKILREQLMNDGFGEAQIAEIEAIRKAEQGRTLELIRLKEIREKAEAERQKAIEEAKKAAEEYQRQFEEVARKIEGALGRVFEGFRGGVKSGLRAIWGEIQNIFNEHLQSIFRNVSRSIAGIFQKILAPQTSGAGSGAGGWGGWGSGAGAGSSAGSGAAGAVGAIRDRIVGAASGSAGSPGGGDSARDRTSWLSNISSQMFGPRKNILTGKTSKLGGIMGGIGDIAAMVGQMIGGKWGNTISMAGMGASIGSMFGPWGAAIGAGAGFIAGLLMGDPKRKRDKKEKLPQLNKGFTDAFTELRQLISDVRALRIDPEGALARATEIRASIASGFGVQFESKKYRKQSQSLISSKLVEADAMIAELRQAVDVARAAGERARRMIPEFAGGAFFRRNGMLPGVFTGRDTIPAFLAPGEMVLNPMQQARVRTNAGGDPFANAGIPGYAGGVMVSSAAEASPVVIPIRLTIDREGVVAGFAQTPKGRSILVDVVEDAYRNDELKLRRR